VAQDANGKREYRLYLQEYRDVGSTIPHLCKVRTIPGVVPEFLADGPDDEPFTTFNLGHFQELVLAGQAKATARLITRFPNLKDGKAQPVAGPETPLAVEAQKPPAAPAKPTTTPIRPTPQAGRPAAAKVGRPMPRPPATAPTAARPRPMMRKPAAPPKPSIQKTPPVKKANDDIPY